MIAEHKISQPPVTLDNAEGQAKTLLESAQKSLGFVPNMYTGMAIAPGLLDTYMHGYNQFRSGSGFSPAEQETVFLTISRYNGCEYCVSAHSMLAEKMSGVSRPCLDAIREGDQIPDRKLEALSRFTEAMVDSRGLPSQEEVRAFLQAGFSEAHILWIVLAIAVKTLSNYSNHLTQPALDEAFRAYRWTD
jgi:uncharacterized peroxidase-related enzyme